MKRQFYLLIREWFMKNNYIYPEMEFKKYGKVKKICSLSSLTKEYNYMKKSPFYNWMEIVGEGLAENSYPLYIDKGGKRLVVAIAHTSFQISMRFLNKKITEELKKNNGCEKLDEVFYITRPDLFKDKYEHNLFIRTKEEQKRLNIIIKEIKKIISSD